MNSSSSTKSNQSNDEKNAPQRMLLREIDFTVESIKQKILEKLDIVKESSTRQAIESSRRSSKRPNAATFNAEALKAFERGLSREIETLKYGLLNAGRPFQPAIVNTVEVPATIGFNYGANVYNEKHNMIISCPSNSHVHFFDGTEFTAMKQRRRRELSSSVVQMSYCQENDTHLMGCAFGDIYSYNATTNNFSKVTKEGDSFILAIAHITPTTYAFSSSKSGKLYFGSLDKPRAVAHDSKDSDAWFLHPMNEQGLLLSGLANGKLAIYDTRKGAKYPMIASLQAHKFGKYVTAIKNVNINGKEYIITGGNDRTIKIWHFIKGKMRLLKVIQNSEDVSTIVYLENYQMIASTHHKDYIKFFKIPSGKLEGTLNVGLNKARNIFLMNDKNMLGVADLTRNLIKVIQLHPQENATQTR